MPGLKLPLCPSFPCEEGAYLLGIVRHDGRVAFTPEEIRIDAEFVQVARQGRTPEARFRFAGPCFRSRCQKWTGERCGVIDSVLEEVPETRVELPGSLPTCSIRASCRWFDQRSEERRVGKEWRAGVTGLAG